MEMTMLALILGLSMVMWYIIDRFKPIWADLSYGKYITMGVSAIFAFAIAFGFGLDLIFGLGLVAAASPLGTVLTGFSLMGGSSAVAEIIGKVKTPAAVDTTVTVVPPQVEGDSEVPADEQ